MCLVSVRILAEQEGLALSNLCGETHRIQPRQGAVVTLPISPLWALRLRIITHIF